jgi:hypothetical protein
MGTCDVLEHARGARIASDDIAAFAQAVCDLLLNDTARERLALLAPIDASKWSSRAFAERLARCYEGAIESRQSPTVDLQRASA